MLAVAELAEPLVVVVLVSIPAVEVVEGVAPRSQGEPLL